MVGPIARREAVRWLQTRGTSLRRACRVIGLSTATWRYRRRTSETNVAVLARLHSSEHQVPETLRPHQQAAGFATALFACHSAAEPLLGQNAEAVLQGVPELA